MALGDDEFVFVGYNLEILFAIEGDDSNIEFLWLEEGTFKGGRWAVRRRLNGDETRHGRSVRLGPGLTTCRLRLNHRPVCGYRLPWLRE